MDSCQITNTSRKKLFLLAGAFVCIPFLLTAQEDTLQKSKIYKTWISFGDMFNINGILYQIKDSSILVAETHSQKDLLSGNYQIKRINYNNFHNVQNIKVRRLNNVVGGALVGLLGGVITGAIIGSISGDDPSNQIFGYSAEQKAIIDGVFLGILGAGIGCLIGGIRIKIPINGSFVKFTDNKTRLRRYSYIHYYKSTK
jgi:hypothetical protein